MADEVPTCEAWLTLAIDEFVNATFFCELPSDHEGAHRAQNQNGMGTIEWTPQEDSQP
jgi:hypothetical protein